MNRMKIKDFRVAEKSKVKLDEWPTLIAPYYESKHEYKKLRKTQIKDLIKQQKLHYAYDRYSLLLIFQAMDAAGKDGAIKHVMSGVNPQGCQVFSFKHPSAMEQDHDFLWRTTQCLPERGRIGIFNRSYYEEVLIVRVHPKILHSQKLPEDLVDTDTIWHDRYRSIIDLEDHLYRNGTIILKFFLHLSKGEQLKRFLSRIDHPDKNWKFSFADIEERKYWPQYMHAYEQCLGATSTAKAPWHVIPADDKKNARLIIADIILDAFKSLDMHYPEADAKRQEELHAIRKRLLEE